jgi:HlyD family secretion protein
MKKLVGLVLVIAMAGGGWWYWKTHAPGTSSSTDASTRPTVATIESRDIRFSVTAAGEISPSEQVSVRPEVNGKIFVLTVDVGDTVKKGELLFKLDDSELQAQRASADKEVERTQLQVEQAERDYRRAVELFKQQLVSQQVFDDSKTTWGLAKNALEKNQKQLDITLEQLKKTTVSAPFNCTVLTRPVSVGQAVSGSGGFNSGTEVLTIANLNDLIINAHINQADVTRLNPNQNVEVTVEAVPGLKVIGKVERIAPQATIKNNIKGFATRILLKDVDKRIRPGMTANISIPVASADNVVASPLAAVFTELNSDTKQLERFAWVKSGDDWERRPITIGVSDYFYVEVTSGLKPGEVVSLEDRAKSGKTTRKAPPAKAVAGSPPATSGLAGSAAAPRGSRNAP